MGQLYPIAYPHESAYSREYMLKRYAVWGIVLFAFCGIAVSTYIAQSEMQGAPLICDIESLAGCNEVVTSEYANLLGISLAQWGLLFYSLVFVLAAFELFLVNQMLRHTLQALAVAGAIVSLYGLVTQVFIIQALCIYCLASVAAAIGIFVCATLIEPIKIDWVKKGLVRPA